MNFEADGIMHVQVRTTFPFIVEIELLIIINLLLTIINHIVWALKINI